MRDREMDHLALVKNDILNDHKEARLRSLASTPLLFPNARLDGKAELSESSHGIALQLGHEDYLRRFAKVLKEACPLPQNTTLRVVGSPSEAPFRGKDDDQSELLNLGVANLRAKTVSDGLNDALAEAELGGVEIVVHKWCSFEEIERSAFPGVDHLALKDPQHQARSVFVEVIDPSACFVESRPVKLKEKECPTDPEDQSTENATR